MSDSSKDARGAAPRRPYYIEICPIDHVMPLLKDGVRELPSSIFSLEERADYRGLKTDKRRRDWLSGRVAAKRAVRSYLNASGTSPDHHEIEICNCLDGRPFARCGRSLNISLSHCEVGGLATVSAKDTIVGADWETVAPRDKEVIDLAFHESEKSPELLASPDIQTKLWTLKEAVIKLLSWAGDTDGASLGLGHLKEVQLTGPGPLPRLTGSAERLWKRIGAPVIRLECSLSHGAVIGVAYATRKETPSFFEPLGTRIPGR